MFILSAEIKTDYVLADSVEKVDYNMGTWFFISRDVK